jgi:hypothetical protein
MGESILDLPLFTRETRGLNYGKKQLRLWLPMKAAKRLHGIFLKKEYFRENPTEAKKWLDLVDELGYHEDC